MSKNIVEYVLRLSDRISPGLKRIQANTAATDARMKKLDGSINGLSVGIAGLAIGYGALKAVNIAAEYEQQGIAFETMLGSVEKGQKLLKDLDVFATKTPFSIQGVQDSAKQLLAVGIESDKLIPTLKALGDVSAGLSVPMDRLALNYGQIRSQGKLTGKELRDFAVAGVPLTGELAKMLNVSESAIQGMVSKGEIGFPIVEKAFKNMTSGGGRFADLMDKQNKSFAGQVNEMKENIQILARNIGNVLIPVIRPFVNLIASTVSFMKKHNTVVKMVVKVILILTTVIGLAIVAIKAWSIAQAILNVLLIANPIGLVVMGIVALVAIIYVVVDAFVEWANSTERGSAIMQGLSDTISYIWNIWKGFAAFMFDFYANKLSALWGWLKTVGTAISDFLEKPIKFAMFAFNNFLDLLEKIPGVGKMIKGIRETFSKGFTKGLADFRKQQGKTKIGVEADGSSSKNNPVGLGLTPKNNTTTDVTSSAPKQFNININKLVENFNVSTQNMKEAPVKVKEMIEMALLEALADIEIAR